MGLSFHYKGKLKEASSLPLLIDEVKDIAITNNFEFSVFENEFKNNNFSNNVDYENLYGICISTIKSEPLCFTFLSNGRMSGLINFKVLQFDNYVNEDLTYQLANKTQYAGIKTHIKFINLLDFIAKKYLIDFECVDEGEYWETRNEEILKTNFERYTKHIDSFCSSIELIPPNVEEKTEDYLIRLTKITSKRNKS